MFKRVISFLMALVLCFGILPSTAFAEETSECTCTTACSEGTLNSECHVCGADGAELTDCALHVQENEQPQEPASEDLNTPEEPEVPEEPKKPEELETPKEPEAPEEPEPPVEPEAPKEPAECSCTAVCTEEARNSECPVCGAEGAALTDCGLYMETEDAVLPSEEADTGSDPETAILCCHGREEPCAVCAVEAMIEALPDGEQWLAMGKEEQNEAYTAGQNAADAYNALPEADQALVGNAQKMFDLHQTFNQQVEQEAVVSSGTCGENLTWTLDGEGTLTISGTGAMTDYNYYVGTDIYPWPKDDVQSVIFEEGITHIGSDAFYRCRNLTRVSIPASVTSIGGWAFYTNPGFAGSIQRVDIQDLTAWCKIDFAGHEKGGWLSNPLNSGADLYINNVLTTDIVIPESITAISNGLFFGFDGLTSVVIPEGVTSIGRFAFHGCTSLVSVAMPDSVTSIGDYAFAECVSLKDLPDTTNVESIGIWAFYGCGSLTSVTVSGSLAKGQGTFGGCTGLTNVVLENDVTTIGYECFVGCTGLTSITIPDGVTSLDSSCFAYCSGLRSITLPDSVTSLGDSCFEECTGLTSITIPDSVANLGNSCFSGCTSLTSIAIPGGVTSLGSGCFYGCTGLTSITIPESITSLDGVFTGCSNLTQIEVDENNPNYCSVDGIVYSKDRTSLVRYPVGRQGAFVIPDGVTSLGDSCFDDCTGLTSVTIPNSVTSLGDSCFYGCGSLTSVTIPNSVTSLGSGCFASCTGLTSMAIPESVTSLEASCFSGCSRLASITIPDSVTSLGSGCFYRCTSLSSITIPNNVIGLGKHSFEKCTSLTSIMIPAGVTSLAEECFLDCISLTSITIPDSVTSIDWDAFNGCTSLTDVYYGGSEEAWANISIELGNENLTNAAIHYVKELTWTLDDDGTLTISGEGEMVDAPWRSESESIVKVVIMPGVISICKDAFADCTALTSVTIPDSVIRLESNCFYHCTGLSSITIPNGVTRVPTFCFAGCTSLTNITIPDSVTSMGHDCFADCTSLTSITIPDGVTRLEDDCFPGCTSLTNITISNNVTDLGSWCFTDCTSLTSITIPKSVTSIGYGCFSGCTRLTDVYYGGSEEDWANITIESTNENLTNSTIHYTQAEEKLTWTLDDDGTLTISGEGDMEDYTYGSTPWLSKSGSIVKVVIQPGVTSIGAYAFADCSNLTSVIIPDGVTKLGYACFSSCTGLTSVTIPESVTSLGDYCFSECTGLTSVTIPESVSSLSNYCFFGCTELTSITIPNSVTSLGDHCFWNCTSLTSITIPDSVTSLGNCCFYCCTGLTGITIPDSVTSLGSSCFSSCTGLTSVTIPDGVTSLGNRCFSDCIGLASVIIPDSVTNLGDSCFFSCDNLKAVTIPDGVTSLGERCFERCIELSNITIPNSVTSLGDICLASCYGLTSITIPESVTSLGASCFYGCTGLTSITIPDSVISLGSSCFSGCAGLTSITIPDSVTSLGERCFVDCSNLTQIEVGKNNPNFCSVDGVLYTKDRTSLVGYPAGKQGAFVIPDSVTNLGDACFYCCAGLTSVTIPDSVTSLSEFCFSDCTSLTCITIPDSITNINWDALENCTSLTDVYYGGSEEDWSKILIRSGNENLTNATIHFNSTGPELPKAPAKPYKIANVVSGVHVYWKNTEGAVKYGLWRSETGKDGEYKWLANPKVPHFTDTTVESGKTYWYKVTSMDATGKHSKMSESIGLTYVATPDITLRVNRGHGIGLRWNKIDGATGYAIYRKSYSGNDAWGRIATIKGGDTLSWDDTSVKNNNGEIYRYTIRALADSNMKTLSGCRSTGRTMVRITSLTLNSAAKASRTSINCKWARNSEVTGYEVRFMVGSEVYKTYTIGNINTTAKTFTRLPVGQTYKIQVRSYKKVDGVGSFYSAWSTAKYVTLN